ncbi:MAG: hypothetical protein K8R54_09490 [Bacteroidales bacterium]|nr:hypothetical protein [Bacteroidales bacterium]
MAKILGLDIGTNSIGWAVVDEKNEEILGTEIEFFRKGLLTEDRKKK